MTLDFLRLEFRFRRRCPPVLGYRILRGTAKTEELLPDRWKAAHPEAVREYREQERRDKADTAVLQAERRRVRAEIRKGK